MSKSYLDANEQEAIIAEVESYRTMQGRWALAVTVIAIITSLFHLYTAGFGLLLALQQRAVHLLLLMPLGFLLYPGSKRSPRDRATAMDLVLVALSVVVTYYIIHNLEVLAFRAGEATTLDLVLGGIMILLILEGSRRSVGIALPIVAVSFLLYAYFGPYMPGLLAHRGFSINRIISHLYLTTEGIFGIPIGVSATFVFLFVLFGAFLERTGVGEYLIDIAFAGLGHRRGGPAKAAVVASGSLGMVSGSSIANAVTTGALTIPIMKKLGFKPEVAAGVEVAASTNGQFLPPVMGAAAFIMVEFTGISYMDVVKAALIPGILSYVAIFGTVHLEALKLGIKGIEKSELPPFWPTFIKRMYYLLPILTLMYMLVITRSTPLRAAYLSILLTLAISFLVKAYLVFRDPDLGKAFRRRGVELVDELKGALEWGARNMVTIALACACAGIIIGVVTLTGLGLRITSLIVTLAGGRLWLTLVFAMIASIILGFGLPTTATYIVMATLTAPALERMGVPIIAAHLFVFYYGIVADDTPPVGLAAYAAAGVAKANPLIAGLQGFKFDLAAFILPFMFVFSPELLMIDTNWLQVVWVTISATIGMYAFAAGIQNFFVVRTNLVERLLLFVFSLMLISPQPNLDMVGLVGIGVIFFRQKYVENKRLRLEREEMVTS